MGFFRLSMNLARSHAYKVSNHSKSLKSLKLNKLNSCRFLSTIEGGTERNTGLENPTNLNESNTAASSYFDYIPGYKSYFGEETSDKSLKTDSSSSNDYFSSNSLFNESSSADSGFDSKENLKILQPALDKIPENLTPEILTDSGSLQDILYLEFGPVNIFVKFFYHLHEFSGLPLWASIICYGIIIRSALAPVVFGSRKNQNRMAQAMPEIRKIKPELDKRNEVLTDKIKNKRITREEFMQERTKNYGVVKETYAKYQCSPVNALKYVGIQLPIYICSFASIRHISTTYSELTNGGILTFVDLSVPDQTLSLGIVASMFSFANLQIMLGEQKKQALLNPYEKTPEEQMQQNIVRRLGTVFTFACIPISYVMPAGLMLHMATSAGSSLFYALLMKTAIIKNAFGLNPIIIPDQVPKKKID